jgi:g-D-glutamyl-meso-diaminopimelate peptidase
VADSAPTSAPTATFAAYGVAQTIGTSAGGRAIESYRFGFGSQTIVLVGGIHGGYEWNTVLLAYEMIDYFLENPDSVPENVSLYIIPSANPDGQFTVTGVDGRFTPDDITGSIELGRFNANQVDLNRNFACDWQPEGLWGDTVVSGGVVPFSEPETAALRTFFLREKPAAVVFWHSKADGIFVGSCDDGYQPAKDVAEIYGRASGYRVYQEFTAYPISGDASDWLATQNIPSFTVELETRSQTEYSENLAGVLALLDLYGR